MGVSGYYEDERILRRCVGCMWEGDEDGEVEDDINDEV